MSTKRRKSRKSSARRRSTRRSTRGSGENSCCPIIRVKCKVKKGAGSSSASPSLMERLKKYKDAGGGAWRANEKREYASLGGIGHIGNAMKSGGQACTVKVGSNKARRMNAAAAGKYVANLVSSQRKKRCIPSVIKG